LERRVLNVEMLDEAILQCVKYPRGVTGIETVILHDDVRRHGM
jgi:hypothetical protein